MTVLKKKRPTCIEKRVKDRETQERVRKVVYQFLTSTSQYAYRSTSRAIVKYPNQKLRHT